MIEGQFEKTQIPGAQSFFHYPECLTAQFLLPCFVASFLDFCNEKTASQVEKDQYMGFVHELILSYERYPFQQEALPVLTAGNFVNVLPFINEKLQEKTTSLYNCFIHLFENNHVLSNFQFKCVEYLKKDNFQHSHGPRSMDLNIITNECHWYSYLYFFYCRIDNCLQKLNWVTVKQDEEFQFYLFTGMNMSPSKKGSLLDQLQTLINATVQKPSSEKISVDLSKIPKKIRIAAEKLTPKQLLSLSVFMYFKNYKFKNQEFHRKIFPLEKSGEIYEALISNKKWKLKLLMASARNDVEDFSLASYQCAKNNICYEPVMEILSSKGKVYFRSPGEITFCPIKHCRWCGLADVETFRVCPECRGYPEYPDLNFFCCEDCENKCLEKQHMEEHAQYLMMLIGLVDWGYYNCIVILFFILSSINKLSLCYHQLRIWLSILQPEAQTPEVFQKHIAESLLNENLTAETTIFLFQGAIMWARRDRERWFHTAGEWMRRKVCIVIQEFCVQRDDNLGLIAKWRLNGSTSFASHHQRNQRGFGTWMATDCIPCRSSNSALPVIIIIKWIVVSVWLGCGC